MSEPRAATSPSTGARRALRRSLAAVLLVASPMAAPAFGATVGHARFALDAAATIPHPRQTARRQDLVVLQAWQTRRLRALKAANPRVRVLMYKNAGAACTTRSASGRLACGVSFAQAKARRWLLSDTSGRPLAFEDFPFLYAADVGSSSYQRAWAGHVLHDLRGAPWDGVFMDDVNASLRHHADVASVARYPTDERYQAAMTSLLAAVGPRLQAAGKLVIANFGSWSSFPDVVRGWLPYTSGGSDEQFLKWGRQAGQGYAGPATWAVQLQEVADTEAAGKLFVATIHSARNDERAARYGYATTLLAADGRTLFDLAADYTSETWFPEYDLAIGSPTGAESVDADGVHRRAFTNGLALVNPTLSTQSVSLGGLYSGSGLQHAAVATMAPQTGLVLVRDGGLLVPRDAGFWRVSPQTG